MRQEYQSVLHEYNTSYDETRVKLQSQYVKRDAHDLVAENVRAQEMKEQQTSELAPGAYMMSKIVESNGSRYRSGRGEHGRYMTTDDYASLYRSRRVCHVNEEHGSLAFPEATTEVQHSRAASPVYAQNHIQREQPVRSVHEGGYAPRAKSAAAVPAEVRAARAASRPQMANGQGVQRVRKAPTVSSMPSAGKVSAAPVVRREVSAPAADWLPSGERYIRVRNQKRFPIAMVMMIVAVSVSLMLIVCGSVMTSHMEREVCALNNELSDLNELAAELENELALKNDPLKMEQLAADLGMVRGEYVQTRILQNESEEKTVVYEKEEAEPLSLATLLSAIGFFS